MKVAEAVARAFVKEGTSAVFGLLGDGQITWWTVMAQFPDVKMIDARDEGAALTMAEGWAMATKRVGVCSVTQGPGVSRMTSSLICATRSRTPIVVYTSRSGPTHHQFLDQDRIVSATGAGYIEVTKPANAESSVRQAFYRARLEARPIVLCVPLDVQSRECDSDGDDYQRSTSMYEGQQRICPNPKLVTRAADLIAASRRPVVLIGAGGVQPATIQAAERIARRVGALTATTLVAKGAFGHGEFHAGISGLFSTRAVMQLFEEADCLIAIGASLNAHTVAGGYLYPNARIIQINIAPHLMIGYDQAADCYIQADAEEAATAIDTLLTKMDVSNEGYRTNQVRKALADADRDPAEFQSEPGTVDPREAVRVIDDRLPAEAGLVMGSGHSFAFPVMGMKKPRRLHVFVTAFGCIGQTLPAAIGVAVANEGRPVVYMAGDGGSMQTIQELDTAARLGVKLLFVILNDEAYGAEYQKLKVDGLNSNLSIVRSPDFATVARGFGCRGRLAKNLDEVAAGVDEFLSGDGPMLLDIRLSRNVVSIPYRRLHHGQDA
jgi:thiamine pyrophosphate-dependent acetolactate synthase large subunit-like protein